MHSSELRHFEFGVHAYANFDIFVFLLPGGVRRKSDWSEVGRVVPVQGRQRSACW